MVTLSTLPQATEQEVFDQVARHLLTQQRVSYSPSNDMCAYRSPFGACAAGCLLADDEYSPDMEGKAWDQLTLSGRVPNEHVNLISVLQTVHDEGHDLMDQVPSNVFSEWRHRLEEVAEEFDLDTTVLEEMECTPAQ
ncbi:hypothetical protein [Cobetia marina]|uniref:hypothetical protein n=1 Tax=Cobetia marina TaxID=28258 RepID=UPI0011431438|nr:hypothetical protein [Cobetia marina]GED41218.1 hypothetical protein HHA02_05470 [Cobetia marina]